MSSRTQSHQLSNGLYVSGRPDNLPKDHRPPTLSSRSSVYTAADLKSSGELARFLNLPTTVPTTSTSSNPNSSSQPSTPKPPSRTPSQPNSGSGPQARLPNSGPHRLSSSGPPSAKKSSGPLPLHPTGLITSGPLTSSGGIPNPGRRSGQLDGPTGPGAGPGTGSGKMVYGNAVTNMGKEKESERYGVKVSRGVMWVFGIVVLMGLLVGVFLMVAVKKPIILVVVVGVLVPVIVAFFWSFAWKRRAVLGYVSKFPDVELRGAVDGQFVKVTGVVTCGSIPLESSFQRVPRCVYVSTELYEYKCWGGKSANTKHRCFSWGSRHSEKYVADFYISDFHSGLRALVKSGYGAKVAPLVEPATVVDISKEKRELSPNFLQWLADRSLSSDDRIMRLKEGYVKEGSTVSVMGVVRRHENVLMIIPPEEPISTGCQWLRCLLPMYIQGLILHCEDNQNSEVIPV